MRRVSLSRLTLLAACLLPACASQRLEGPPHDLHALATPEPMPVMRPAPAPSLAPGRWRAWVPPQTTSNGDRSEGHWLDLPLAPPQVEVLAPTAPMPRAPKTPNAAAKPVVAPTTGASGPAGPPASAAPTLRLPRTLRNVPGLLPEEHR
jgi:hypothetical protein